MNNYNSDWGNFAEPPTEMLVDYFLGTGWIFMILFLFLIMFIGRRHDVFYGWVKTIVVFYILGHMSFFLYAYYVEFNSFGEFIKYAFKSAWQLKK